MENAMAYTKLGMFFLISYLLTVNADPDPSIIPSKKYLPLPWAPHPWTPLTFIYYPAPRPSIIPPKSYLPYPWLPLPKPRPFVEESCARTGGQCVRVGECPTATANPDIGLCPLQPGFECCYGG
ncbi:unnamed protein product, partial [Meganyctiphanes norvegica]